MAEDLRLQKTYDALTDAFSQLISQKSFEQITVKELCTVAKTRTATFYSHFSDKYDFFAFIVKRMRHRFIADEKFPNINNPLDYFTSLIQTGFDFIEKNERILCSIDANSMLAVITHTSAGEYRAELAKHFVELENIGIELPIEPDLLAEMFVGAMSQTSRWWFEHRNEITKEEMVQKLSHAFEKILGI